MDEIARKFDSYVDDLRDRIIGLPGRNRNTPHFRAISAATGIDFKYLIKEPYKQRVILAGRTIGITPVKGTKDSVWESRYIHKRSLLSNYLKWLQENALTLPEHPLNRGRIFFEQVEIEAGLDRQAIVFRKSDGEQSYTKLLRKIVEKAIPALAIEVRILPQSPGHSHIALTYEQLFDRGTEQRRTELKDKPSAGPQLSNTRSALNLFLKTLSVEKTAPVGHEFICGFKESVELVTGKIENGHSRKKFQTEIRWWRDIYQQLMKAPSIPDSLPEALTHLIARSGLNLSMLAKLIGVSAEAFKRWCQGSATPSPLCISALCRMESLFKIPAGTLVNKVSNRGSGLRFRLSALPPFLQKNPKLFHKVSKHLPDNFCSLPLEKQEHVVGYICKDILCGDDAYAQRLIVLRDLEYRHKGWPIPFREEFIAYANFKMAEMPPLGMKRSGKWRLTTKEKNEADFAYLTGALCLSRDTEDLRLRGLGLCESQLTLAVVACPMIIDWYIRFRCGSRGTYTKYAIHLLNNYKSMLRPVTGWLRQNPQLASRLREIQVDDIDFVPQDLVTRAQTDWDKICDEAIKYYDELIKEVKQLVTVARDPFHRIDGILNMEEPTAALEILIRGMRNNLPDPHTQPVFYHTSVRDCAIALIFIATGLRRNTVAQLDYTGDKTGHLFMQGDSHVLSVPRKLFKEENSSYFGPAHARQDYLNELPDIFGLKEVFAEYLKVSRPFLMNRYHGLSKEQPLFIKATGARPAGTQYKSARLGPEQLYVIYREGVERYLVENKFRGTGIPGVKRTGPHSVRHIRGTTAVKKTGSFQIAADANQNTERMAREYYARFLPVERNRQVNDVLYGSSD